MAHIGLVESPALQAAKSNTSIVLQDLYMVACRLITDDTVEAVTIGGEDRSKYYRKVYYGYDNNHGVKYPYVTGIEDDFAVDITEGVVGYRYMPFKYADRGALGVHTYYLLNWATGQYTETDEVTYQTYTDATTIAVDINGLGVISYR